MQVRTGVKSAVKKVREAIARGDMAAAKAAMPAAERALASARSKGVVHKNAASRRISRLAAAVAKPAPAKA
jgi:small subunit ribosomal protein S20